MECLVTLFTHSFAILTAGRRRRCVVRDSTCNNSFCTGCATAGSAIIHAFHAFFGALLVRPLQEDRKTAQEIISSLNAHDTRSHDHEGDEWKSPHRWVASKQQSSQLSSPPLPQAPQLAQYVPRALAICARVVRGRDPPYLHRHRHPFIHSCSEFASEIIISPPHPMCCVPARSASSASMKRPVNTSSIA